MSIEKRTLEKENLLKIGFVGIETAVLGSGLRRAVWGLLVLSATIFMFYHIYDRISAYLQHETMSSINQEISENLQLPTVTICPLLPYDDTLFKETHGNYSDEYEAFLKSLPKKEHVFLGNLTIGLDRSFTLKEAWTITPVELQLCYQFNADGIHALEGPALWRGVKFTLKSLPSLYDTELDGYVMVLSAPGEFSGVNFFPIYLQMGQNIAVGMNLEKTFHFQNNHKCGSDSDARKPFTRYTRADCDEFCYSEEVKRQCGCVLAPDYYRHLMQEAPTSLEGLLPCVGKQKVCSNFGRESMKRAYKECFENCPQQCQDISYKPIVSAINFAPGLPKNTSVINLYYTTNVIITKRQVLAYRWLALMADIGGATGLFLGASLFTLVQAVEILVEVFGIVAGKRTPEQTVINNKVEP